MDATVSVPAVLLASLVSFIIGWVWYSPLLFGNIWMKQMGIKKPDKMTSDMKSMMMRSMILGFVFALVSNYVLAHFVGYMSVSDLEDVAELGGWLWLGFTLPIVMNGYIWEKKSLSLTAIAAGQTLVSLVAGGWVLVAMA